MEIPYVEILSGKDEVEYENFAFKLKKYEKYNEMVFYISHS